MRMLDSNAFDNKKILVIDQSLKKDNDRTWCFWEETEGYFEHLVFKKWNSLHFKTDQINLQLAIAPYVYKMIRGIDFYNYCFSKLHEAKNVTFIQAAIDTSELFSTGKIVAGDNCIDTKGATVFNSIYSRPLSNKGHYLLQHFMGWVIETQEDVFKEATLMDFSISQERGTSFFYVLPLSANKALVEFTLFTKTLLQNEEYEAELRRFISEHLNLKSFEIIEKEFGIIPMSSIKQPNAINGIFQIGIAGGLAKGSTGYTFKFIQEHSDHIIGLLEKGRQPQPLYTPKRFEFYDRVLLHILANNILSGKEVFQKLFDKNGASKVFKFLDNKTTLPEEFSIIKTLPTMPFLKAAIKETLY